MNARELALDLMQLDAQSRDDLLSELPELPRTQLIGLIREAEGLAQAPGPDFEAHLHQAERATEAAADLRQLNEGQLRLLLSAEQPAVQRRVIKALHSGEFSTWPSAVRQVVVTTLRLHRQTSSIPVQRGTPRKPRWWHWLMRKKSA